MKLYLSSFRLGESPEQLARLANGQGPVAFISNALDFFTDLEKKNAVIARGIADLKEIGLESHPIDLREYFDSPERLRSTIAEYRIVFVTGGNSFILRRALERSGMDFYLHEKKDDADFLYVGYSAGACVAGPTMKGLHLVDDPEELPDGYLPEVSWDGLSLIDYSVAPHFNSDHFESDAINKVVSCWIENKILFRVLRDGEVLIHGPRLPASRWTQWNGLTADAHSVGQLDVGAAIDGRTNEID